MADEATILPDSQNPRRQDGDARPRRDLRSTASALAARTLLFALIAVFATVSGSEGWSGAAARGDVLASQHRLLSAIAWYQEAALRPGGDPVALFRLGSAYLARGQWQESADAFRLAEVGGIGGSELLLRRAAAEEMAGNREASLATLRRELAFRPEDGEAWVRLVDQAARAGMSPPQIERMLSGVPAPIAPPDVAHRAAYLLAACLPGSDGEESARLLRLAESGPDPKTGEAARHLSEAYGAGDDHRSLALGREMLAQGLLGPALSYLEDEVGGPHEAERQALLGYVLLKLGRADQAEAALRESQRLDPELQVGLYMLGSFLRSRGDVAGGARLLRQAAEQKPANPAIYLELANALVDLGDYSTAEQAVRLAVQAAPESGEVRLAAATFYVDRQYRADRAIPEAAEAVRLLGRSAAALSAQGWALHLAGRSRDALAPLLEAVSRDPESAPLRYRLGSVYEGLGRLAEGREQYLMVAELDASGDYSRRAQAALDGLGLSGPK